MCWLVCNILLILYLTTSVAKAMKVLRKLGCCLQIEVGIVWSLCRNGCLVRSQKLLSKIWLYSIHDVISYSV